MQRPRVEQKKRHVVSRVLEAGGDLKRALSDVMVVACSLYVLRHLELTSLETYRSLGCVMYELVTLKKPFMARSVPAVMKKIIQADFIPVIEEEAQRAKYEKIEDMDRIIKSLLVLEAERRKSANSLKGDPLLKYHIQTFREDLDKRAGSLVLTTSGMFQTGKAQIKSEANAYASTASIVSEDSEEAKVSLGSD